MAQYAKNIKATLKQSDLHVYKLVMLQNDGNVDKKFRLYILSTELTDISNYRADSLLKREG